MSEIRFRLFSFYQLKNKKNYFMNIFESKVETNIHSSAQIKSNQIKSNQSLSDILPTVSKTEIRHLDN